MPTMNKRPDDDIIKQQQETNTGIAVAAGEITHSDYDDTDWQTLMKNSLMSRH